MSRLTLLIVLLAVLWATICAVGVLFGLHHAGVVRVWPRAPAARPEDPEQRRQEVAAAFATAPAELDPAEAAALHQLFDGLGAAMRRGDTMAVGGYLDSDRMAATLERLPGWPDLGFRERRALASGLQRGLSQAMVLNPALHWDRVRVQRFYPAQGAPEAVVYVRHWQGPGPESSKIRWWLVRDGARWRFYDLEDLDSGVRVSTSVGTVVASAAVGGRFQLPAWASSFQQHFVPAIQAFMKEDLDAAEQHLAGLPNAGLPSHIEAMRFVLTASVRLRREDPAGAVQLLDRAERLNADLPIAQLLRAAAYNRLDRHEEAAECARKHLALLGDDALAYENLGVALEALGQNAPAADAFRKSLDDAPDSPDVLHALCRVLNAGQMAEIGPRFARLPKPSEHLDGFAGLFAAVKNRAALDAVLTAYAAIAPDDPATGCYRAIGRIIGGDSAGGAEDFRTAVGRVPSEKRSAHVYRFLNAMTAAGKTLDGYRAAPDPTEAFRHLASVLLDDDEAGDTDELGELMTAHRARKPEDPWLDYYEGLLRLNNDDDPTAAETVLAAGIVKVTSDDDREAFRSALVGARLRAGNGLSAYRDLGPRKATFNQLAQAFALDRKADDLGKLLAAHRANDAADADLPAWQAEYHWLRCEYAEAAAVLMAHRDLADKLFYAWRYHDRLVRSLVRAKRLVEASRELSALPEPKRPPLLAAVVAAAAGDVGETTRTLETYLKQGGWLEGLYRDEDLGPLLRGDGFKAFREKHPEPPPAGPRTDAS
jgi:tetratricopeptide (TPR) repeat protein